MTTDHEYVAFEGLRVVARGPLAQVLEQVKQAQGARPELQPLFFDESTGRQVDFDLRGSAEDVVARACPPVRTGPGRPKLGVVPREISLLPRHWEWLEEQPNGASAAIRRLVDEARKGEGTEGEARRAREATARIMTAVAGNLPGFEEALRALYAADLPGFAARIADWPEGLRDYLRCQFSGESSGTMEL